MYTFFVKYRQLLMNGVSLFSLIIALFLNDSAIRDFFIGLATGVSIITFGAAIEQLKSAKKAALENNRTKAGQ